MEDGDRRCRVGECDREDEGEDDSDEAGDGVRGVSGGVDVGVEGIDDGGVESSDVAVGVELFHKLKSPIAYELQRAALFDGVR